MVVIGIDTHKRSHTAVAVDEVDANSANAPPAPQAPTISSF